MRLQNEIRQERNLFKECLFKFFLSLFTTFFLKYQKDTRIESVDALFVQNIVISVIHYNSFVRVCVRACVRACVHELFIHSFICSLIHSLQV